MTGSENSLVTAPSVAPADGHTVIDGLTDTSLPGDGHGPAISVLARTDGATVIRLVFREGQVMADHRAGRPILIVGQSGEIDVAVDGDRVALTAGGAVHIAPQVPHALTAHSDAVATLLVLTAKQ